MLERFQQIIIMWAAISIVKEIFIALSIDKTFAFRSFQCASIIVERFFKILYKSKKFR